MFSSIRSRLWLSYALVISAALTVVAVVFFIYIVQNPSTYRQASANLTVVAAVLRKNEANLTSLTSAELQSKLTQVDNSDNIRIVIYNSKRYEIADSQSGEQPALQMPRFPRLRPYSILRDKNGNSWLYILRRLDDGRWLLLAVPRPAVPFLTILSDELMLPILGAAVVALFVSFFLAFWFARWIGNPLQQVVAAAHKMPASELKPITLQGPQEVQELAKSFNQMNARVQSSQKSQRDFVADVSHELKTPLTSVQGFAQALMDGTAETTESRQQAARVIHDEAGRMYRIVVDLLDLARLDAGTLDFKPGPVDLAALLNGVAKKFSPQATTAGVEIRVENTEIPMIIGDGDRLEQVFTNIVDNALKNTPSGGHILLQATLAEALPGFENGQGIRVAVSDTGVGISPESLPHIFERFYMADKSRQGGEKHGTGLGLAIVKEIVEAHGGKISVQSTPVSAKEKGEGEGSTFTVILPLSMPDHSYAAQGKLIKPA